MIWELIRKNRIKSVLLLFGMGAVLFALGYYIGIVELGDALAGIVLAVIVWLIVVLISYWGGKSIMLANTHAQQLQGDDPRFRQLFNLVEEMKIAANLDFIPQIYVITDRSLNAFAVGNRPANYAIVLTMGLVDKLNRDELQGVIAHELSHISNKDSQFMTLAGTMLGSIQVLSRSIMANRRHGGGSRYRSSKSKSKSDSAAGAVAGYLFLIALAILGYFLATLLYFAISRKREYLADASAVRLTRYPEGLASALEKISRDSQLASANSINAPMFIVNPLSDSSSWGFRLSTHPPIYDRIDILRKMSGGADFSNYQHAYSQHKGANKPIIPSETLQQEARITLRSPEQKSSAAAAPAALVAQAAPAEATFCQTADVIRAMHGFAFVNCGCGLRIKIPFGYKFVELTCPRCGRLHTQPAAVRPAANTPS